MILAALELAPAAAGHLHGRRAGATLAIAVAVLVAILVLFALLDMAKGRSAHVDREDA